eukprot:m51a1_g13258 hypothetical protein (392) ;mRNA; r:13-3490
MAEQTTSTATTTISLLAKDCPVCSVTVFNDRAEVVRTVSVDAQQPGTYEVRLRGLTQRVEEESVHVSGGQGHAVILEVSKADEQMAEQTTSTATTTIALLAKDCPVSSVTVFNDRAEVVRTVSVDAQQPGTYEVRLQGLTQRVDRSSVHVSGGQGHAVILEVSCSDESVLDTAAAASAAQQHTARAAQLSEELRAAEQQRAALEVQLYVAHEAQAFTVGLAENVRATPRVEAQDQAFLGADYLERVKDFTDFYTAQLDTFCSRSSELTRRMAELADRVAVLKREIEASRHLAAAPAQRLTSRSVWVAFTATAAGRVALQVAYVVAGASWRAAYDCRVESATARAQLTYYGVITNSSGDCWDDTSVFLSTATPSVGGQLPRLPTCTASIFRG